MNKRDASISPPRAPPPKLVKVPPKSVKVPPKSDKAPTKPRSAKPAKKTPEGGAAKRVTRSSDDEFEQSKSPPKKTSLKDASLIQTATAARPLQAAAGQGKPPRTATAAQPSLKLSAFLPPAGVFPKSVLQVYHTACDKVALQAGDGVGKKTFADFGVGQDVSPDSTAAAAAAIAAEAEKTPPPSHVDSGSSVSHSGSDAADVADGDAELYDVHNASAVDNAAIEASAPHSDDVHIDLGHSDASGMPSWWDMFLNSKCGGGFLARSLFSAAAQDSVLGSQKWAGPTSVTQKKQVLSDMRSKFIEWNENPTVNEWVRAKIFHIIVTNPKTYAKIKVNGVLQTSGFLFKVDFF